MVVVLLAVMLPGTWTGQAPRGARAADSSDRTTQSTQVAFGAVARGELSETLPVRTAAWTEVSESGGPADRRVSSAAVAWLLVVQCTLIVLASFFGGCLPRWIALTHTHMQMMISFVGGLMLGIGLLHLLPHAAGMLGSLDRAVLWTVLGTMTTFFLLRTFHFHHHEPEVARPTHWGARCETKALGGQRQHATAPCNPMQSHSEGKQVGPLSEATWIGVALGLGLHTLVDGAALAASVHADVHRGLPLGMLGLGTFLVILLHKPLDALSIVSLMQLSGRSERAAQTVNFAYSLMCPLGAGLFVAGVRLSGQEQGMLLGSALAFAAGVFLCIAMSDLLPELEFHAHDRLPLSVAIVAGVLLAYFIGFLEPAHQHPPGKDLKVSPAVETSRVASREPVGRFLTERGAPVASCARCGKTRLALGLSMVRRTPSDSGGCLSAVDVSSPDFGRR